MTVGALLSLLSMSALPTGAATVAPEVACAPAPLVAARSGLAGLQSGVNGDQPLTRLLNRAGDQLDDTDALLAQSVRKARRHLLRTIRTGASAPAWSRSSIRASSTRSPPTG